MADVHPFKGRFDTIHSKSYILTEPSAYLRIAIFNLLHEHINFCHKLWIFLKRTIRLNVCVRDGMICFLIRVESIVVGCPHHDCHLPAHVVYIILNIHIISCPPKYSPEGVTKTGISDMPHMQRAVWICRCVFKYEMPLWFGLDA